MVTFADLMALMMTFFVLLYSFSKIDEERYKNVVDSMAQGFDGVQWIKRHLSEDEITGPEPGILAPLLDEKRILEQPPVSKQMSQQQVIEKSVAQPGGHERLFQNLKLDLANEIASGLLYIEQQGENVIVRFPENVSFTSGSDQLVSNFIPVIHRISSILSVSRGRIIIAGHTDDRPISTERFRSNWELSAARAVSVAHRLLETGQINRGQIAVTGYADTRPLMPNDSNVNRARNRRVEISVIKAESSH